MAKANILLGGFIKHIKFCQIDNNKFLQPEKRIAFLKFIYIFIFLGQGEKNLYN